MIEEYEKDRKKQVGNMRSIMDYTMGIVFFCIGIYFLLYQQLGWNIMNRTHSMLDYFIGGLFLLYGIWRFYRGYKKNYFN
jgi:threonine/homoserine/homoserine lactone efflux protein